MKYRTKHQLLSALLVAAVAGSSGIVLSATATDDVNKAATTFDQTASTSPTRAETEMAKTFASLAGSEATALSLVEGLHTGTQVVLDPGSATTIPVTVTPTAPMGYGNVFITLALAQENLKQAGIATPTSADLAVALNGGTVQINGQLTTFRGILAMRTAGMGWGQIAKELGFNLGRVVSALKSGNEHLAKSIKEGGAAAEKSSGRSAEKGNNRSASDNSGRMERVVKVERHDKVERSERPDKPERTERVERAERPERPDRPDKVDRPGKD